jgi:diaminopropionate ammonia-lyase
MPLMMSPNEPLQAYPTRHFHNPRAAADRDYSDAQRAILNEREAAAAGREIARWPGYTPSPLHCLRGLAARAGVGSIAYHDESRRFGLGSFKALGGAYAVYRHLARAIAVRTGQDTIGVADLAAGRYREIAASITVCCATDGNHGRSVAWGARTFGCACVIYVHETVSAGREAAIAAYGARVVRHPGNYDEAVHRAARDADANGWVVVSDTSYDGYTDIPRDVMHGYTLMADEALRAHEKLSVPTHVFVQGGVGGLAAAVCARAWWAYGGARPRCVVVEPERAACLFESARAGRRVMLSGDIETVMAGLSCGEPSLLAWEILDAGADDFMTVPDAAATDLMRVLADGVDGDPPIVCGESAGAGLAGMLAAMADPPLARALGLDAHARVLVFGTEGDTDPELYTRIVGRSAEAVRGGA